MYDFFMITTQTMRGIDSSVLDFKVTCKPIDEGGETLPDAVASLKGFVHQSLQMPATSDFYVYDDRSRHCAEAHSIMLRQRRMIKRQLPHIDFEMVDRVVVLERVKVEPAYRGHGLALRLMREAQHLFAHPEAFAILKAHPDGENVSDADCLRLAGYYASDRSLDLKQLSKRALPGWLVANWLDGGKSDEDDRFWSISEQAGSP